MNEEKYTKRRAAPTLDELTARVATAAELDADERNALMLDLGLAATDAARTDEERARVDELANELIAKIGTAEAVKAMIAALSSDPSLASDPGATGDPAAQVALALRPDGSTQRITFDMTRPDDLLGMFREHLGADTNARGHGAVAFQVADDLTMWAKVYEGDVDVDFQVAELEPNIAAGFVWWFTATGQDHVPIFGTVLYTGSAHPHGVHGIASDNLLLLEKVIADDTSNERLQRDGLRGKFAEAARNGLMFQCRAEMERHGIRVPADPRMN